MKTFGRTCVVGGILALALGGCQPQPKPVTQREAAKPPHTPIRVDSAVPREIALTRFQQASQRATAFEGGAPSRDALVRSFVRAVETKDTATLRRLVISRGEFAYLSQRLFGPIVARGGRYKFLSYSNKL